MTNSVRSFNPIFRLQRISSPQNKSLIEPTCETWLKRQNCHQEEFDQLHSPICIRTCRERERNSLPAVGNNAPSNFQSSFVNHCFLVYLVATLLNKIKQFLQVHSPRVKNAIAILSCLERNDTHWPVNLGHQCLGHDHLWKMLLSFLNSKGQIYLLS